MVVAAVAGSSSDSLSLDSEGVLALGGNAFDCGSRVNFISHDQNVVKRTFPFVTGGLGAGWSSSEDDCDDSPLDSSFFFPFLLVSFCAYPTYVREIHWKSSTHTRAMISFEFSGALCFALGIVATGFFKSTAFLATLALTSVLAVLVAFFSDFFSDFLSDLAIADEDRSQSQVEGQVGVECAKFSRWKDITSSIPDSSDLPHLHLCQRMSDLDGNFDVIILGTGLVESIAAA